MELDETGEGVLFLLQRDVGGITTGEMADRVGVSASTVGNRIERTEERGISRGYRPDVDYDDAGLQLYVESVCSAPNPRRAQYAGAARDVGGVVSIREIIEGDENVQTDAAGTRSDGAVGTNSDHAVGTNSDHAAGITDELDDIGLDGIDTRIIKDTHVQPFAHFGRHLVEVEPVD